MYLTPYWICFFYFNLCILLGFSGGASGKEPACQCRKCKRCRVGSWIRTIPWRRAWQHTPGFLPGEFHGQRSLTGYSPWGCKESNVTDAFTEGPVVRAPSFHCQRPGWRAKIPQAAQKRKVGVVIFYWMQIPLQIFETFMGE